MNISLQWFFSSAQLIFHSPLKIWITKTMNYTTMLFGLIAKFIIYKYLRECTGWRISEIHLKRQQLLQYVSGFFFFQTKNKSGFFCTRCIEHKLDHIEFGLLRMRCKLFQFDGVNWNVNFFNLVVHTCTRCSNTRQLVLFWYDHNVLGKKWTLLSFLSYHIHEKQH